MKKLAQAVALSAIFTLSGCSLNQMIKASKNQSLTVTPNPLEVHADTVNFEIAAILPVKTLKKGKIYTVNSYYKYGEKEDQLEPIEFKADDYPNSNASESKTTKSFSMPYSATLAKGNLEVEGVASDPKNGKSKVGERLKIATGVITTSKLVEKTYYPAYAEHGYNNKEELIPVNIGFFFLQGRSDLRHSEKTGERGKELSAFIADKNVTKSVTIIGSHSPEGTERVNTDLSKKRAKVIEEFYKKNMDKYDYKGIADSIDFIIKPIIDDWTVFKKELRIYKELSSDEKSEYLNIVNGSGTFEEKEKSLKKLPTYKKVFNEVYPKLRIAKTEILKVKEKKTDAEISILAKKITDRAASTDVLSEEEMMYAASLTPSLSEKEAIYKEATKKSGSWNSHNNLGATYIAQFMQNADNTKADMALTQLEIANNKKESAQAYANLGSVYLMQGNAYKANEVLKKAASMSGSNELTKGMNGVKGVTEIIMARYSDAISSASSAENNATNAFNKGLAQLLNKDFQNAIGSFDDAIEMNSKHAMANYGAAIANARLNSKVEDVVKYLKNAISIDPELKNKALNDLEFQAFSTNEVFRAVLN